MAPVGKWGIALGAMVFCASDALATQNIMCNAPDNKASLEFLVGTTPGLNPLGAGMEAGNKKWATKAGVGVTPIVIAQAFSDDEGMKIDIADDNLERIIAKLRATWAHDEGSEPVLAGTLLIIGVGAWPVTCSGE